MRVLTSLGALCAAAALTVAAAPPAAAALPSQAPLADRNGTTNGCVARAVPLAVTGAGTARASLVIEATLRCEAAAGVRWYSFSGSLFEVVDSGGLRNIYGPQLLSRAETAEPLDGKPATGVVYPCSTPGMKGTHTYLARWTVKTKTSADDPNPFVAKIARKQTVTCA